ncbi:hypothetical protein HPB50_020712 [Hyalomma asiaticum]|uniref:Uncharacterized protein n=1 Tax=Hyalomma asiaticum TaxID=266040 RepID=A0ACB7TNC4_HYAAI|nr:hypothetical protein HPB50_020712 [Hyalomma asiaticum]
MWLAVLKTGRATCGPPLFRLLVCLAKLPHDGVGNAVAFNPKYPEMLVTASEDFTMSVEVPSESSRTWAALETTTWKKLKMIQANLMTEQSLVLHQTDRRLLKK